MGWRPLQFRAWLGFASCLCACERGEGEKVEVEAPTVRDKPRSFCAKLAKSKCPMGFGGGFVLGCSFRKAQIRGVQAANKKSYSANRNTEWGELDSF